MRDEFEKEFKEINNIRTNWNYLGRFGVPSFWGNYNWMVSSESFCDQFKSTKKDLGWLAMQGKEAVSSYIVVNGLCMDFTILVMINNIIQNIPATLYQIISRLVVVITKYKNIP